MIKAGKLEGTISRGDEAPDLTCSGEKIAKVLEEHGLEKVFAWQKPVVFWRKSESLPKLDERTPSGLKTSQLKMGIKDEPLWVANFESAIKGHRGKQNPANPSVIRDSWMSGTDYDPPKNWVTGVRGIIKHGARYGINLEGIAAVSPVKIFLSGPHGSNFDWKSNDFGHYNPEFVKWAADHLIPGADDPVFRKKHKGSTTGIWPSWWNPIVEAIWP